MEAPGITVQRLNSYVPFSFEFSSLMYRIFYASGLDSMKRPGFCVAVCCIIGAGVRWFHSHGALSKHAEYYMVQSWEQFVLRSKLRYIVIRVFQNYSPCATCSDIITQFVKSMNAQNIKVNIKLSFAGLYKISRNPGNPEGYKDHFTVENHFRNCRGLDQLAQNVYLGSFEHFTWMELKDVLNLKGVRFPLEQYLACEREQADISIGQNLFNII